MKHLVLAIDKFRCTGKFLDQFLIRDRGCSTRGGVQVGILAAESVSIEPWLPEVAYLLLLRPGAIQYRLLRPHSRRQQQKFHVQLHRLACPDANNIEAGAHSAWPATVPAPAAGGVIACCVTPKARSSHGLFSSTIAEKDPREAGRLRETAVGTVRRVRPIANRTVGFAAVPPAARAPVAFCPWRG